MKAGPGTYVFEPREIPHGFKVEGSAPASLLLLCAPAGFENFVVELSEPSTDPPTSPDMAKLAAVAAKYQIDILGPLPEQPELSGSQVDDGMPEPTSANDNEVLNARWIQAFNKRGWGAEGAFRARDFQAHMSGANEVLHNDAWAGFMSVFTTAFPDARIAVDNSAAEGDTVFSRWTLTGTHLGEFQGVPPSGKTVSVTGIDYSRVAGGKFVEHWAQFDMVGLLRQIGAMPASLGLGLRRDNEPRRPFR